jgi:GrpB-like predicted nucleotidyltransferase (UPF0157 family)
MRKILVVPYNPEWPATFEKEASLISQALGTAATEIHHIGSTSIPGIFAKPIIDILVKTSLIDEVDDRSEEMEAIGFEVLGESGIAGRRYFRKCNDAGLRLCHVHIFAHDSEDAKRHIAFRDYMLAHPVLAEEYSELKQALGKKFPHDIDGYMDGKVEFIKNTQKLAMSNTKK